MAIFFPAAVYLLCFATSATCALLLARNYRKSAARLLLWSALCFALLAANNLLVFIDLVILPNANLQIERLLLSVAAVAVILFGLIWDLEQ
jgi:hypothetical protein